MKGRFCRNGACVMNMEEEEEQYRAIEEREREGNLVQWNAE